MSGISPAAVLYSSDGYELNVTLNNSIPTGTRGILTLGSDGTNARPLSVSSAGVVSIQGVAGGTAIPVSGSITATNAAVSTTGAAAPGSASLSGALVVSATPTYTAGNMNALNITTAGRLLIDGSQVTQPVSGTVTANAGTGNFNVIGTGTAGTAATGVVTIQGISGMTAVNVAGANTPSDAFANPTTAISSQAFEMVFNGTTWDRLRAAATGTGTGAGLGIMRVLPHDGTNGAAIKAASTAAVATDPALVVAISPNNPIAVSTDGYATTAAPTYGNNTSQPLSLDTSGNLRVNVTTGSITASSASTGTDGSAALTSDTQVGGKVTTAAPTYTTGNLNALSLTTLGGLRIDGVYAAATANATAADVTNVGGYVTTAAPTYTTGQLNPLSLTTAGALRVDASATTQPVSGTVTANAGTGNFTVVQPTAASLNATVVQTTAANLNATVIGTTAAGSGAATGLVTVQGNAGGTPIPVSGTVTANAGTGNFTVVQSTAANLRAQTAAESAPAAAIPSFVDFVGANVVSAAPTYTAGNLQGLTMTTAGRLIVDGSQVTQPVSGTVGVSGTVAATQSGNWTVFADGYGFATTAAPTYTTGTFNPLSLDLAGNLRVNVATGTITASSASTGTDNAAALTSDTQVGGKVVSATPTYTAGNLNALTLTTAGRLIIDGSQVTQPVSGTVTANAGTGNFNVIGTGAAGTAATGVVTVQGIASMTPIQVSQATAANLNATVVGTGTGGAVSVAQATAANLNATVVQATAANLNATVVGSGTAGTPSAGVVSVQGVSGGTRIPVLTDTSSTANITSVAGSTSNTSILAVNANRVLATIFNGTNKTMYLALGTTASTTSYTIQLAQNAYWELPLSYTGAISAVWASGVSGNALVTELT
jgi:hypothetical protein